MSLSETLREEVIKILTDDWSKQDTSIVPAPEDLILNSNRAKKLTNAVILYADIDGSTDMVSKYDWQFSAEVYKSYLRCAAKIIVDEGGTVTAYDGDRIMAIFMGYSPNSTATRVAMKINYAVIDIIRPLIKYLYPDKKFVLKHSIGIDTSDIFAARIGIRGDNDVVWVGKAANTAAKLCTLNDGPLWITHAVYSKLAPNSKFSNNKNMWESMVNPNIRAASIYRSNFKWKV